MKDKMKKILFVCSHLYSGSAALCDILNNHPRIQGFNFTLKNSYSNPLNLINLTDQPHKLNNRSAIYMDELIYNYQFSTKDAYKYCKFLYLIREPEAVLKFLIVNQKFKPQFAIRYYTYRLRRLCEMAKRTPGAVLLTWNDLDSNRGISLIEDYLGLKQSIIYDQSYLSPFKINFPSISLPFLADVENTHEKYLYYLKNQNIQYWS
jgi:hypothetical protein